VELQLTWRIDVYFMSKAYTSFHNNEQYHRILRLYNIANLLLCFFLFTMYNSGSQIVLHLQWCIWGWMAIGTFVNPETLFLLFCGSYDIKLNSNVILAYHASSPNTIPNYVIKIDNFTNISFSDIIIDNKKKSIIYSYNQ
jgi:hypothetical protein